MRAQRRCTFLGAPFSKSSKPITAECAVDGPCAKRLQNVEGAQKKFFRENRLRKHTSSVWLESSEIIIAQALGLSRSSEARSVRMLSAIAGSQREFARGRQSLRRYRDQARRAIPVSELFTEFLVVKQQDNVSRRYLADLRSKLGRFVASPRGSRNPTLRKRIENWIRSLRIGTVSRESYRRNLSTFLEFGRRRGYSRRNPAADIKIRRRPEGEVSILTPEELRPVEQMRARNCALRCNLRVRRATPI